MRRWNLWAVAASLALGSCATGQDVYIAYIAADVVRVIPHNKAVAFLQQSVRRSHTGYECKVSDTGIAFPPRSGMPDYGVLPFQQLRARTVWASWAPSGAVGLVVLAEGVTGLLTGDRCILYIHPNPGPLGTRPPANKGMSTALEALVSLGASYSMPPESSDGSLRVYMPVGF